jgi:hypothetical protein
MRRQILLRIACLSMLPAAFAAQCTEQRVYQWTDSKGVVHYSQFEPERLHSQARDLHSISDPTPPPPKTPEQTACDIATANQAMLAGGKEVPYSKNKDADGKPVPMTADEIKAAKDLAERQIQVFCKKAADEKHDDEHDDEDHHD